MLIFFFKILSLLCSTNGLQSFIIMYFLFLQQMGQIFAIVQVFTPDTIGFLTAMPNIKIQWSKWWMGALG